MQIVKHTKFPKLAKRKVMWGIGIATFIIDNGFIVFLKGNLEILQYLYVLM